MHQGRSRPQIRRAKAANVHLRQVAASLRALDHLVADIFDPMHSERCGHNAPDSRPRKGTAPSGFQSVVAPAGARLRLIACLLALRARSPLERPLPVLPACGVLGGLFGGVRARGGAARGSAPGVGSVPDAHMPARSGGVPGWGRFGGGPGPRRQGRAPRRSSARRGGSRRARGTRA